MLSRFGDLYRWAISSAERVKATMKKWCASAAKFLWGVADGVAKSVMALLVLAALGLTVGPRFAGAAETEIALTDVRIAQQGEGARVVLELTGPVEPRIFTLAGGRNRIVVDLQRIGFSLSGDAESRGAGPGAGAVAGYRYAHNSPVSSRIVLDLARPAAVERSFVIPSGAPGGAFRVVLDLSSVTQEAFDASQGFPIETLAQDSAPADGEAARELVVVIDPGHGGKDPGAVGPKGLLEKSVNLKTAQALRDRLSRDGRYRVVMTRAEDEFLTLDERSTLARKAGADLFISIHADANENTDLRGASVYTLSDKASSELANSLSGDAELEIFDVDIDDQPPEVGGILLDLAQRETQNQSAEFAEALIPHISKRIKVLNNTHRRAGYRVLLSPDVPAVLVEIAFMSNAADAANLASAQWRGQVATAIADAIDEYFDRREVRQASLN
ncbi:MAG: N-acetylmuramoyl-L-alanine amidase [Pseudomonadota bacterium]